MEHHLSGPLWGNIIIIALGAVITLACFAAMIRMLLHPGEADRNHPKHDVLKDR